MVGARRNQKCSKQCSKLAIIYYNMHAASEFGFVDKTNTRQQTGEYNVLIISHLHIPSFAFDKYV